MVADPGPAPSTGPLVPPPGVAPGWYSTPEGVQRYWDGSGWTSHTAPIVAAAQPAPVIVTPVIVGSNQPMHVSGLTTGQHIFHGTLTVLTGGLWGIVWAWKAFSGRRRIS